MHTGILIYGNDEMLLTTRRMIFEKSDYTVFTANTLSNAALVLMSHQVDIFILCQSLRDEERHAALETAHTLQPEIKIAALSFDGRDIITGGVHVHDALNGPAALLAAVRQMSQEK